MDRRWWEGRKINRCIQLCHMPPIISGAISETRHFEQRESIRRGYQRLTQAVRLKLTFTATSLKSSVTPTFCRSMRNDNSEAVCPLTSLYLLCALQAGQVSLLCFSIIYIDLRVISFFVPGGQITWLPVLSFKYSNLI